MSKRLPYFQFEPAEWLAGDIMFCSLQAQGLFVTIKALYWQKECDLTLEQAKKRLKNDELFDELITEQIIAVDDGKIKIDFLDKQYLIISGRSKINALNGALGGRPKTQKKPNGSVSVSKNESETEAKQKHIDKIREDNNKIREDNKGTNVPTGFSNPTPDSKIDYQKLISFFNSNRGVMPEIKVISEARKKRISSLIKNHDKEKLMEVILACKDSNFMQGRNDHEWVGDFDWITQPKNFIKILEGNYKNKENGKTNNSGTTNSNQGYKPASVDREKLVRELTDDASNGNIPGDYNGL